MQETNFDRSVYERPDREWICGHTNRPCALGPDARGSCATTHECVPAREGERWRCTRTPPFGGECERGPSPDGTCCNPVNACQPRRGLRARRGRLVLAGVGLTIGFLALSLTGERALDFVYPGPVTKHHGTLEHECQQCHAAGEGGLAHWISLAFATGGQTSDFERCLSCHDLGGSNLLPHSLPVDTIAESTERIRERALEGDAPLHLSLASRGPARNLRAGAELSCSVCHREHRGADHDLTALSNDQCQVCHVVQFDRFEEDHPALGHYPHGRRPRIVFDPATHIEEYFVDDEQEAITCVTCHAPEPTGRTMDVGDFASSCGDCHESDVREAGTSGIAFLNLPAIDVAGLRRSGFDPGQWPRIERSRTASPFVALLLAADPRLSEEDTAALTQVAGRADGASALDREERARVARWAWATKALIFEIVRDGHRAITSRLESERVAGKRLGPQEEASLVRGLDRSVVERAVDSWFPDLEDELAIFDRTTAGLEDLGQMTNRHWTQLSNELRALARSRGGSARASEARTEGGDRWVSRGGWYISGTDASLRYRSSGHADPFLRTWFEIASVVASLDESSARSAAVDLFDGLRSEHSTGSCTKCHSIDPTPQSPAGSFTVAWQPHRPDPARKRATEFRHVPHFSLDARGQCSSCHRLREADPDAFAEAYREGANPDGHVLNFEPIGRETCGTCHTREAAGDDCVTCHNYHLGSTTPIHLTAMTATLRENRSAGTGDE